MNLKLTLPALSIALSSLACSSAAPDLSSGAAAVSSAGPTEESPGEIATDIHRDGARAVVMRLSSTDAFDKLLDHVSAGEDAWIALAPLLAPGTDAGTSEALSISLATALPKNARAVLEVLDPATLPLSVSAVCDVPFIEIPLAEARDYVRKATEAVSAVHNVAQAEACLITLRETSKKLGASVKWDGKWSATWISKELDDHSHVIDYEITVNGTNVVLTAAGFETDVVMQATGTVSGSDLVVTFDACSTDDLIPQCSKLEKGDEAFHLHREGTVAALVFDKLRTPPDETKSLELELELEP
jgi:hypothetical protein